MSGPKTILCPIDFSDGSRIALTCARWIADQVSARLLLHAVEDPLLTEAVHLGTGIVWDPEETRRELTHFSMRALGANPLKSGAIEYEVTVGKPDKEILRVAQEQSSDLIVMSTHGLTGMRKLFFGSTTERVLRETTVPVLVTPPVVHAPLDADEVKRIVRRLLVPVDMTAASAHHVHVASTIAQALQLPLIATHVVEPVRTPLAAKLHLPSIELERRRRAEDALNEMLSSLPKGIQAEALVGYGDPAEEIAKIARDRQAGLIVIGLQGSPVLGPHMGSVTYRVLCLVHALVLAVPPPPPGADTGPARGDRRP